MTTAHSNCTHPATKVARAACRKGICAQAFADTTCTRPSGHEGHHSDTLRGK